MYRRRTYLLDIPGFNRCGILRRIHSWLLYLNPYYVALPRVFIARCFAVLGENDVLAPLPAVSARRSSSGPHKILYFGSLMAASFIFLWLKLLLLWSLPTDYSFPCSNDRQRPYIKVWGAFLLGYHFPLRCNPQFTWWRISASGRVSVDSLSKFFPTFRKSQLDRSFGCHNFVPSFLRFVIVVNT